MNPSFRQKFKYHFDNLMSRGTPAMIGMLFLLSSRSLRRYGSRGLMNGDIKSWTRAASLSIRRQRASARAWATA